MSGGRLHVAPRPCSTCPYRRDTPPGVWHPNEYAKLPDYDDNASLATFLCHQTNATGRPTVCRGWLTVHAESAAARLSVLRGEVSDEDRYAPVDVALYASGTEAAMAGMAGVEAPSPSAEAAIGKLLHSRAARHGRSDDGK